MDIKVLGTGCARCEQLETEVRTALAEMNIAASLEKVDDIQKILSYNIMQTPALVINEKIKSFGRVPKKEEIKRYIEDELSGTKVRGERIMNTACDKSDASACCPVTADRFVVSCSGGSNVGQVANLMAIKMTQQGLANMTCLAALGAHLPDYIEKVKDSNLVVLDGCPVACARQVVEHIGLRDYQYFVVTEMGVEKVKRFDQVQNEAEQVWEKVVNRL